MDTPRQEPIIIELDDPTPGWQRVAAVIVAVLIVALIVTPWLIDIDPASNADASVRQSTASEYAAVCQPRVDIPSFAEPVASVALPSWMRLCDWFVEPGERPVAMPTQPVAGPISEH